MNSATTTIAIQRTFALASALTLLGTPALVVGRTIVQGEITPSQLERLIENERHLQSQKIWLTSHLYVWALEIRRRRGLSSQFTLAIAPTNQPSLVRVLLHSRAHARQIFWQIRSSQIHSRLVQARRVQCPL
jgi:hypothetical protein